MNNKHHAGISQVQKCMNLMCSWILWRGKLDSMSFYASICCVFECFYPFTKEKNNQQTLSIPSLPKKINK